MNEPHGIAIVCERAQGHTVAWVDAHMSKQVPAGYFVEVRQAFRECVVMAGQVDGYYFDSVWFDWYDAVVWCREHAQGQAARKRLIAYAMIGHAAKEAWGGGGDAE